MLKFLFVVIGFLLFFEAWGEERIGVDSTRVDSTGSTPSFFGRIYRGVYGYFTETNQPKEEKRFDFSVIGGPHFSSDTKLGLGMVASGLYRVDRTNLSLPPSNISFYGDVTTTGFYLLGIRGNTIFKDDHYRLNVNFYFFSFPSRYWGIGYERGSRQEDYTTYKRLEKQVKLSFSRKLLPNFYVGATTLFRHVKGDDFENMSLLNGEGSNVTTLGFGGFLSYDSRDFLPNAYRGIYTKFEWVAFPDFWGHRFQRTDLLFRAYKQLWQGAVLASDLEGTFNYGNTPWSMVALMGGSYQMRGYYEGQYRDRNLVQAQVELRQHIYNRHGVAVWGGAGNVFADFDRYRWKETLPTYGIGYRWEFKKRVNVRLDYGFGRGQSAFYFNIDEAF